MLGALRTTRGFGVHSPFAYKMVKDVLTDRHGFYAYDEIGCILERNDTHETAYGKTCRLMLRLANHFPDRPIKILHHDIILADVADVCNANIASTTSATGNIYVIKINELREVDELTRWLRDRESTAEEFVLLVDFSRMKRKERSFTVMELLDNSPAMAFRSSNRLLLTRFNHLPRQQYRLQF